METNVRLWYYVVEYFLEWAVFQTKVVEKIKTYVLYAMIPPSSKIVPFVR